MAVSPRCPQPWGAEGSRQLPQSSGGFIPSVEGVKFGEGAAVNAKGLDVPAPTLAVRWRRCLRDHSGVVVGSWGHHRPG